MKMEYELSLNRNKVINVFKYVVFIMAFMVAWMIGENSIVSADSCLGIDKSYVADVTCNTNETGVRNDEIRIMQGKEVHFPLNNNLARIAYAFICRYDSDKDCVGISLHDNTNGSNNIVQSDLKIKRDGTIEFDYKIGAGAWYTSDHGEWKKIDKNLKDVILKHEEEYQYNSKGFRLYLSLLKPGKQYVYRMYINVGAYYFDSDIEYSTSDEWKESHTFTAKYRGYGIKSVCYVFNKDKNVEISESKHCTKYTSSNVSISTPSNLTDGKYYLTLGLVDSFGNIYSEKVSKPYKIDKKAPVIKVQADLGVYSKKYTASIPYYDDASKVTFTYCWKESASGSCVSTDRTISDVTGKYYLYVEGTDEVGHKSTKMVMSALLDNEAPKIKTDINNFSGWHKDEEVIYVDFKDDHIGYMGKVEYIFYSSKTLPGIPSYTEAETKRASDSGIYRARIEIPTNKSGELFLHIKAVDSLGNPDTYVSNVMKIDGKDPAVSVSIKSSSGTGTVKSSYTLNVSLTDEGSGIGYAKVNYCLDRNCNAMYEATVEEEYPSEEVFSVDLPVEINENTIGKVNKSTVYIAVYIIDHAGNENNFIRKNGFTLDTKPPSINIGSKSQLKPKLDTGASTVMLSMQSNVTKVVEEVEVNEAHVVEEVEQVKEVVEVMPVVNEVSVVGEKEVARLDRIEMHVVDRAICEIKCSIMLGGTYLFGKRRKRINVC